MPTQTVPMRAAVAALLLVAGLTIHAQRSVAPGGANDDRVVLITLDGARIEEVFGGLDTDVLRSTLKDGARLEDDATYRRFWAATPEERRRKLMPFFWTLVTDHGSIAGNPARGSAVKVSNRHWFSYPGYAEILLGEAHDETIKSNDPIRNPYPTVLEGMRAHLGLAPQKVAMFGSWGVFNEIAEHTPGSLVVNAGIEPLESHDGDVRILNRLQHETPAPWDATRLDSFTFHLAMRHLAAARPRVLYLALGETDDWAHDGRYDRVLEAYSRSDGYLRELWTWLQEQPDYRGRTHLLITTDHGRGHTSADWRNHGATTARSNEVWVAVVSPAAARRGEWRDHTPLWSNQFAATMASWVGLDWAASHPASGRPLQATVEGRSALLNK